MEGGKGYWLRYNCFRKIAALVSVQETYNTNLIEKTGSIESPPELSIYNTNPFSNFVTAEGRSYVDTKHYYRS